MSRSKPCWCGHAGAAHTGGVSIGPGDPLPGGCSECLCTGYRPDRTDWRFAAWTAVSVVPVMAAIVLLVAIGAPWWTMPAVAIGAVVVTLVWNAIDARC